jgi:hypothetical protein
MGCVQPFRGATGARPNVPVHLWRPPEYLLAHRKIPEAIMHKLLLWAATAFLTSASLLAQTFNPAISSVAPPNAVPEGTIFLVQLEQKLDTAELHAGQHFKVRLSDDLVSARGSIIPRGRKIKGHVSSVEQGLHARLLLSFDEIETDHGWVALIATVTGVPGEHAVRPPDSEGVIENKGTTAKQMIEDAAVGAALGSGIGAGAGGAKAAGTGAGVGAAAGAVASLLANRDVRLEKGTSLEVRLDRPLQIPSH